MPNDMTPDGTQESKQPIEKTTIPRNSSSPDDNILASVLDEVLKATASAAEDDRSDAKDLEMFQDVARRFRDESILLEVATVELVKVVYARHYPEVGRKLGNSDELASEISAVMMESPATKARIQAFWNRLVESVS